MGEVIQRKFFDAKSAAVAQHFLGERSDEITKMFAALCKLNPDQSLADLLVAEGITPAQWREFAGDPNSINALYDKAHKEIILAYLPALLLNIAKKAHTNPHWATLYLKIARIMPGDINVYPSVQATSFIAERLLRSLQYNTQDSPQENGSGDVPQP